MVYGGEDGLRGRAEAMGEEGGKTSEVREVLKKDRSLSL